MPGAFDNGNSEDDLTVDVGRLVDVGEPFEIGFKIGLTMSLRIGGINGLRSIKGLPASVMIEELDFGVDTIDAEVGRPPSPNERLKPRPIPSRLFAVGRTCKVVSGVVDEPD